MNYKKILESLKYLKKNDITAYKKKLMWFIIQLQKDEITGKLIYEKIAKRVNNVSNKQIILNIADQEKIHEEIWFNYTKKHVKPKRFRIFWYTFLARTLGYTFAIRLMEEKEADTKNLELLIPFLEEHNPRIREIIADEEKHEDTLIAMLKEEKLYYVGSVVLGLNDALVEFSGALAGFTFAYLNNRMVALTGLITGVAAALSMMSSEYFSSKAEIKEHKTNKVNKHPFIASLYTGVAYILTVFLLVAPYLFLPVHSNTLALVVMLFLAIFIIFIFNYYIAVTQRIKFLPRFFEMTFISLGVAFVSFLLGIAIKHFMGITVS